MVRFAVLMTVCLLATFCAFAERQTIDGVTVECVDGVCRIVDDPASPPPPSAPPDAAAPRPARFVQGMLPAEDFLSFLRGEPLASPFAGRTMGMILLLVLLGGLALNLTPCVLPMMPINLMIIGRSALRGICYGAGIAVAYGLLGLLASLGGWAFGEIQGSAWFNAFVAVVFLALSLSLMEVFFIDLSRFRRVGGAQRAARDGFWGGFFAFCMGALSAVLAGACVAPILISVLLLTADLVSKGVVWAFALPFVLGLGMALPWPFAAAGVRVLPQPGRWMKCVNRFFALVVLGFALWYGFLAYRGFRGTDAARDGALSGRVRAATPETVRAVLAAAPRPVLVDCWATWCKNCAAMERTTLSDPRVVEALRPYTVVRLQAEDIRALRAIPGFEAVRGLPAFFVFE